MFSSCFDHMVFPFNRNLRISKSVRLIFSAVFFFLVSPWKLGSLHLDWVHRKRQPFIVVWVTRGGSIGEKIEKDFSKSPPGLEQASLRSACLRPPHANVNDVLPGPQVTVY